jgi:hypothetical protein
MAVENTRVEGDGLDGEDKATGQGAAAGEETLLDEDAALGADDPAEAEPDPEDEELDEEPESDDDGEGEEQDEPEPTPTPKPKSEPKPQPKALEKPKAKYLMDDDELLDAFGEDEDPEDIEEEQPPQRERPRQADATLDDLFAPTLSVKEVTALAQDMDPAVGKAFTRMAYREEQRSRLIRYAMGEIVSLRNEVLAGQTADVRQAFAGLVDAGADEIYGINPASASKSQKRNQAKTKQLARQIRQRAMAAGEPVSVTRAVQLAHRKLFPAPPSGGTGGSPAGGTGKGKTDPSIVDRLKKMQRQRDFVPGSPSVPSKRRNADEAMDDAIAKFL